VNPCYFHFYACRASALTIFQNINNITVLFPHLSFWSDLPDTKQGASEVTLSMPPKMGERVDALEERLTTLEISMRQSLVSSDKL